MVGMRLCCAYSSLRKLTRSIQMPRTCEGQEAERCEIVDTQSAPAGHLPLPDQVAEAAENPGFSTQEPLPARTPSTFMRAVSRCLDWSGLLMITATWCVSSPCMAQQQAQQRRSDTS